MIDNSVLVPVIAKSVFAERHVASPNPLLEFLSEADAFSTTTCSGVDNAAEVLTHSFHQTIARRKRGSAHAGGFPVAEPWQIPGALTVLKHELDGLSDQVERIGALGLGLLIIHPLMDGNGRLARMVWCRGLLAIGMCPVNIARSLELFYSEGGFPAWQACRAAAGGNDRIFMLRWRWAVLGD